GRDCQVNRTAYLPVQRCAALLIKCSTALTINKPHNKWDQEAKEDGSNVHQDAPGLFIRNRYRRLWYIPSIWPISSTGSWPLRHVLDIVCQLCMAVWMSQNYRAQIGAFCCNMP